MSVKSLDELTSFINDSFLAKDKERVFTYIEFVKEFGYENSTETFLNFYKEYLVLWNNKKKDSINKTDDEFVNEKLINILKSITLDYSSYEEQDFIAHIDWTNKDQIKGLVPYYSRKIREITEFYRKKRNDSHLVVKRNSMRGSTKSIEEIIYTKIIDFVFNNRNVIPSYANIKRDLIVSVENYVDTYSEYFDIPRNKDFSDRSRQEMLSANMNDVDYRNYLEISLVISEILFSGNVHLKEIPLIAQLGLDLSQSCVGDMLALKNTLVANTTINQIPLSEQVALKRNLYEKYLGCDLYYMYVDLQKNIKIDRLCKAKNPTGNLLNCGSVDTATIESGQLELLTHVGLFFKPDKTSILKISAKDFSWSVNEDKLEEDTIYIFPDPSKYGDIGNNKSSSYPLIMEYKMDYDIRNLSSGDSVNDPLMMITDQGWRSYYSKQEDDFKMIDNINFEYAFTSLANRGIISSYQTDLWGNQFGLFKGYKEIYKTDENGNIIYDNSKPVIDKIQLPSKYNQKIEYHENIIDNDSPILLNGGYMEDPYHKGKLFSKSKTYYSDIEYPTSSNSNIEFVGLMNNDGSVTSGNLMFIDGDGNKYDSGKNGTLFGDSKLLDRALLIKKISTVHGEMSAVSIGPGRKYVPDYEVNLYTNNTLYKNILKNDYVRKEEPQISYGHLTAEDGGVPFDFTKKLEINSNYRWTGIKNNNPYFYIPSGIYNEINFGEMGITNDIEYIDNYEVIRKGILIDTENVEEDLIQTSLKYFTSSIIGEDEENDVEIESVEMNIELLKRSEGVLYVRNGSSISNKPILFTDYFYWTKNILDDKKIINIQIIHETILVETENDIIFIKYGYDGNNFFNPLINKEIISLSKKDFISSNYYFVEKEKCFYICQLELVKNVNGLNVHIFKFDCKNYTITEHINFYDVINKTEYEKEKLETIRIWSAYIKKKNEINKTKNVNLLENLIAGKNKEYPNFGDLSVPYLPKYDIGNVCFTYNSSLKLFLISFVVLDLNGTPFLYECKFRMANLQTMHDTMKTNLYSIGGASLEDDVESRYMSSLSSSASKCFPDDTITVSIFEEIS